MWALESAGIAFVGVWIWAGFSSPFFRGSRASFMFVWRNRWCVTLARLRMRSLGFRQCEISHLQI